MTYHERLKAHLADYKRKRLGDFPPGEFLYRSKLVYHDHILPLDVQNLNLMASFRPTIEIFLAERPTIKKHRYFHHLNSSQAFALNLFVPFFEGSPAASAALLRALGQSGSLKSWEAEAVPDRAEGTNLDAKWETTDGMTTFCEVKLSEADFGKAKCDDRHFKKLREIYLPRLEAHCDQKLHEPKEFFSSYQILRNVWHMVGTPGSRLVFLIPRANTGLWKLLGEVLPLLNAEIRGRITTVAIEGVIDHLIADSTCPLEMRALAEDLKVKYVVGTPFE